MGKSINDFGNFGRHFSCATSAKILAAMYARVPQAMAQFVLKIEKLSHIMAQNPNTRNGARLRSPSLIMTPGYTKGMLSPKSGNSVLFISVLAEQLPPHCLGYHYLIIQLNKYYVTKKKPCMYKRIYHGKICYNFVEFFEGSLFQDLVWLSLLL